MNKPKGNVMQKNRGLLASILVWVAVFSLSACAVIDREITEVPVPVNFQAESMMKLQSVSHWNNVATDMAASVSKKYGAGNGCIKGFGCQTVLYVKEPAPATRFSRAFHTQLVSALVNQGLLVVTQPKPAATTVDIDIQVVQGSDNRVRVEYDRKPTELSDGVWVIRDLVDTSVQKFKNLNVGQWSEGEANKNAWFKSPHNVPPVEMMVTVSFVNDGNYIARTSNVYYLASADGYVAAMPASATSTTAKSAADSVASPGAVGWTMQVVGDCTPARCFTK